MTAGYSAYTAYAKSHSSALKGRAVEGEALMKAARLLDQARTNPDDTGVLLEALKFSHKLWTIFQADLSNPDNPLPAKTRKELLELSLFMDREIAASLQARNEDSLQAMIDINRTLASALFP